MNKGKLIFLIISATCLTINLQAQIKSNNGFQQNAIFGNNTSKYLNVNDDNLKSRKTAILLGLGITSIPIITNAVVNSESQNSSLLALITGPLWILGPTSGLIYAENYRSAANGSLIRLGGVASIGIGAIAIYNGSIGLGALIIAFGTVVNIYSAVKDIFVKAPRSVDEYNENLSGQSKVILSPWYNQKFNTGGLSARIWF